MKIDVISPFPMEALPRVWGWTANFRNRVSDDFSPKTLDDFVEVMLSTWANQKTWAVYGDGELGGVINFQKLSPWLGTAHCVFKPDFQGKNIAPEACRIAIDEMFQDGIGKLSFYPLAGNLAIGSLLIRLGAKREGCLKAQTLCGGKPTAMNIYGLLKEEFYASIDHCLGNRGRSGDSGGSDERRLENEHVLNDSDSQPRDESLAGQANCI